MGRVKAFIKSISNRLGRIPQWQILGFLLVLYFITRLWNLTILPIFTDEAIYIYWAKVIADTKSQFFLSMVDGKPPLFIWAMSFFFVLFPTGDTLLIGRLVSVGLGAIALGGVYTLTRILFNSRLSAGIASFLFIFSPFLLTYDRLALFDTALVATTVWAVVAAIRLGRKPTLFHSVVLGGLLVISYLTKPTGMVFWVICPLVVLWELKRKKEILWVLPSLLIAMSSWGVLHLSSAYPAMVAKNQQFQYPLSFLFTNPLIPLMNNIPLIFTWLSAYLTPFAFSFSIVCLIYLLLTHTKKGLMLTGIFLAGIFPLAFVAKELFPRYILFTVPYLYIAIAGALPTLLKKTLSVTLVVCIMGIGASISVVPFLWAIWFNPPQAAFPQTDYDQLVGKSPSGYGLEALYAKIDKNLEKNTHVTLITQGTFGLFPYAFTLRYWKNPKLTILPQWPVEITQEVLKAQTKGPVLIAVKDPEKLSPSLNLSKLLSSPRPTYTEPILLYTLNGLY